MTKARIPQPEQQPEGALPVRVIGVHLGASKTTRGKKQAVADFAARLEAAINMLVAEGRSVSSSMLEGEGAIVVGRLTEGPPPQLLALMQQKAMQAQGPEQDQAPYVRHQRLQVGPPGEGFEINELSHHMVQQFMTMVCQMPPMPAKQREHMVAQLFNRVADGVAPNDLQAAAVDVDKILTLRKQRQGEADHEQLADDALLAKMRDMLLARVRIGLN